LPNDADFEARAQQFSVTGIFHQGANNPLIEIISVLDQMPPEMIFAAVSGANRTHKWASII
jgi:hypothetical protein